MMVRFYKSQTPFSHEWDWCDFEAGQTIADICGDAPVRAWINGREVSAVFIERARLKQGVTVYVRPIPELPAALAIAAAVASGAAASAATWTIAAGYIALSVALSVASTLVAKSQIENPGSRNGGFDRLNALTGGSNQIAEFEPIPKLFGRMRYFPPVPMTAKPYTEIAASDQFLRMFFVLNDGHMDIGGHIVGKGYPKITHDTVLADTNGQRPVIIGETDIAEYDEAEWEIGTPDQMTLYTDQIIEENPGWTTESDASDFDDDDNPTVTDNLSTVRTTDTGATGFSIDLVGQLYCVDSKGRFKKLRIRWLVEWRPAGSSGAWESEEFTQQSSGQRTSRQNFTKNGLAEDQYDIRLTRISTYFSNLEGEPSSQVQWNALRTIRDRRAFTEDGVVVMNLRIRSTDQLNGVIDKLGILGTSVLDVYENGEWIKKATRAHAWAFNAILTDQSNGEPIDQQDIRLESLLAWEAETEAAGRYYDTIYDNNLTTLKRIQEVTEAGRATWTIDPDTKVRVVLDTVQTVPKMVISPRNSWGYQYQLIAYDPPHGYKVRFVDSETWEVTERIVYDDGYDESNATRFETIDAPGCTNAEQAWKHGRYQLANTRLRGTEKHTFSQELKHYHYGRGDLLALSHDVIRVGLAWGRIKSVVNDNEGRALQVTTDEFLPMDDASEDYALKIQRLDGTVQVVGVETDSPGNNVVELKEPVDNLGYDDHFSFGIAGKTSTDVKLVSISPIGNKQARMLCEPAAPEILDAETGLVPEPVNDITVPPDPKTVPPNVPSIDAIISDSTVAVQNDDGSLSFRMAVNVSPNAGRTATARIIVQARADEELRWTEREAQDGVAWFTEFYPNDSVDVRAKSISQDGRESKWVYFYNHTVVGLQPEKPTGVDVTRGTFSVTLSPLGGPPAAVYEYWMSGTSLAEADIEQLGTKAGQGKSLTIADLNPNTTYYFYVRRVNINGNSDFYALEVTTKNDPSAVLGAVSKAEWRGTTDYVALAVVSPTPSNRISRDGASVAFQAENAGTSGGTEPDWSTITALGDQVTDGDIVWRAIDASNSPFLIVDGRTFIDTALIDSLTFNKLTDGAGTFLVENGKIKGQYLLVDDAAIGNAAITTAKIADAAITAAKIGDAQITNAKIGNASVDTLQLAGQAVTLPLGFSVDAQTNQDSDLWRDNSYLTIPSNSFSESTPCVVTFGFNYIFNAFVSSGNGDISLSVRLLFDGVVEYEYLIDSRNLSTLSGESNANLRGTYAFSRLLTLSSASHQVTLQSRFYTSNNVNTSGRSASNRFMTLIGLKR